MPPTPTPRTGKGLNPLLSEAGFSTFKYSNVAVGRWKRLNPLLSEAGFSTEDVEGKHVIGVLVLILF